MIIGGLQKLTLLDYPTKMACTVFTDGCNFRCPFCHNALLVTKNENEAKLDENDVLSFLKQRAGILEGVCITGGEPLLQNDIEEFIIRVKNFGYKIKLDTNGSNPEKLEGLIENGLIDYVAMDIKNSKENYAKTIGLEKIDISSIEKSVELLKSGKIDYEFRTTLVKQLHSKEDFVKIGEWLKGNSKYFLQQYVVSENLIGDALTPFSKEEMQEIAHIIQRFLPKVALRGV